MWKNVYLINLDRRKDRLENCTKILDKYNINFNRFSAISPDLDKINKDKLWNKSYRSFCRRDRRRRKEKYTIGALGCKMSHYYILKKAKELNLQYVTILEDDIIINEKYLELRKEIDESVEKLINRSNDWDVIYIGGNSLKVKYKPNNDKYLYRDYSIEEYSNLPKINEYCIKVDAVNTTLGYIVNRNIYNKLLSEIPGTGFEIDRYYNQYLFRNKIFKINPEIFYQNFKDSDICNKN